MTLPSTQALAETAAELALAAQLADDRRNLNALNKAAWHLACGVQIVESAGDLLIPSATTAGQVYRVSERGCTCQAGMAGAQCWHASLVEIIQTTRERLTLADAEPVSYEQAVREMDELFA